jgi:hypothetical protein
LKGGRNPLRPPFLLIPKGNIVPAASRKPTPSLADILGKDKAKEDTPVVEDNGTTVADDNNVETPVVERPLPANKTNAPEEDAKSDSQVSVQHVVSPSVEKTSVTPNDVVKGDAPVAHTNGVTDNKPIDWDRSNHMIPPAENARVTRVVSETVYAAVNENDDKGLGFKKDDEDENVYADVNENDDKGRKPQIEEDK